MLRVLSVATLVSTLGRGVFLTLTVLYFTLVVGLGAGEVAIILAVASGVGVVTSLLGGQIADRFSARRILVALTAVEAVALASYTFASSWSAILVIACVVVGANRAANSTRSAIIARAFEGRGRVGARAVLRTVTNVGIAIGGGVAGIPLLLGTPESFRTTMIVAGLMQVVSAALLLRLPRRVDADRARDTGARDTAAQKPAAPKQSAGSGNASAVTDGTGAVVAKPGRSPFRNPAYLALTALAGILGMQFAVFELGLPVWIVTETTVPTTLVAILLVINTVLVIAFQIPLSRGTHDVRTAGRVVALAGVLLAVSCALFAASGGVSIVLAVVFLVLATLADTFAEILQSAGTWGLSFELADPARAGAYQGVFAMGFALGAMVAPLVINATVISLGALGWGILAVMFALAGFGVRAIARRSATVIEARSAPA